MATWKEKGEVLDSDDDDPEESQSFTDGERDNQLDAREDTKNGHITLWDIKHRLQGALYQQSSVSVSSTPHFPELRTSFGSPQESSQVFNPPLKLSEQSPAESLRDQDHVEDEISRSYVSLSSPLSSLPSSIFLNPGEGPPNSGGIETYSVPGINDDWDEEVQPDVALWGGSDSGNQDDTPTAPARRSRTLRERNPIQIHPFLIEEERYRRTLKASNIKPLRLASVQVEVGKAGDKVESLDPDFEPKDDSQNAILKHPSQLLVPDENSDSLNSSGRLNSTLVGNDDNDDEFPEIYELLNITQNAIINSGQVSRKLSHSFHGASLSPSKRYEIPVQNHSSKAIDVFKVPPSPPRTSSPLPMFSQSNGRRGLRPAISASASSRPASPERTASQKDERIGRLPTPTTNTVKHTADRTVEGSENIFDALESESEISLSSDSDQSSQIRRIGKKIRGVLPASWIRLDQKIGLSNKPKVARHRSRHTHSSSPPEIPLRRGVAIVKDADAPINLGPNNLPYPCMLSDESEGSHSARFPDFDEENSEFLDICSVSSNEDISFIIEEDQIDAMLQSRKRQANNPSAEERRKIRRVSTSISRDLGYYRSQQPKITEHLIKPRGPGAIRNSKKRYKSHKSRLILSTKLTTTSPDFHSRLGSPPKLSILDVIQDVDNRHGSPQFIRIAARNARSRASLGRHSPIHKFIRLTNREDTFDAQSTLQKWREGAIPPKTDLKPHNLFSPIPKLLPGTLPREKEIEQNTGQKTPEATQIERNNVSSGGYISMVGKPKQTRINWQVQPQTASIVNAVEDQLSGADSQSNLNPLRKTKSSSRRIAPFRPAQLETSGTEYNHRHPNHAFRSTKRTLDALYKKSRRGPMRGRDIRMSRFLAAEKLENPAVITDISTEISSLENRPKSSMGKIIPTEGRRHQKRPPMRIDAGAAKYQQLSDPLILDYLQSTSLAQEVNGADGKLVGLGSVGFRYTSHFNIFPLQLGVYFHESTLLGSGKFSKILESSMSHISSNSAKLRFHQHRVYKYYELAEKMLRWGPWDEVVSSELGVCFDWIAEQLDAAISADSPQDMGVTRCLTFIVEYVEQALEFPSEACYRGCLFRFIEVLDTFMNHIQELALNIKSKTSRYIKAVIDASTLGIVLLFQVIQLSRLGVTIIEATSQLEALLQKASTITVRLLLLLGLECIRDLYDDLQYLAFRESGIKSDRYSAQAWVIIMYVLQLAQIPRHSFWDVVNSQLITEQVVSTNDARVFERVWYAMFSLLPLVEFDKLGVLTLGLRQSRQFENWSLPQRIAKRIFELYGSRSKQSPSFNEYCRALFHRCFLLIQVWGWRRHSAIIGTLFDFFASHKLSHLRNEDSYKSPHFLEQLDCEPSLAVEPEDRCFHILLKIIATAIKQLRGADDMRGIRNLIARVLPNHDRQYPKEESVTQRDLASLRNNHDLLCTLFWAAPPNLRPPISLIRELVNPENSHSEAYLINLQAWKNLAKFILSSSQELTAFQPLREWQTEYFGLLLAQYLSAEKDMEQQLAQLSKGAKRLISQNTINKTLQKNREHIRMALTLQMRDILQLMSQVPTMECVSLLFDEKQRKYLSFLCCTLL